MIQQPHPDSAVIDTLGGAGAVARICRVTSQAVSQWRRTGIPDARRMYLEAVHPHAFGGRDGARRSDPQKAAA